MSRVTLHMSCVTIIIIFVIVFSDKGVKLVDGGSVINRAKPSSFLTNSRHMTLYIFFIFYFIGATIRTRQEIHYFSNVGF